MTIGYIGLGKMGLAQVWRLIKNKHRVVAWNRSLPARILAKKLGAETPPTLDDLVLRLPRPRRIWLMVSPSAVSRVFKTLLPLLKRGDIVIDGGNSHYRETVTRARRSAKRGILYFDAGVSGGPAGARTGACIMVGGDTRAFRRVEKIIRDLASPNAYAHVGPSGAGHFAKMVHNGIEYGMMQALAEGFAVLKKSTYTYDLAALARLYNRRSVIESRLVCWLKESFRVFGEDLKGVSGSVAHTGEGKWTVEAARALGVPVRVIEDAYLFRVQSEHAPSYTGKILSALRNRFGGHSSGKKSTR